MTAKEQEISQYLATHNYSVDPQEFISKFLNCNYEIKDIGYDLKTDMVTLFMPNTEFTFKWNL